MIKKHIKKYALICLSVVLACTIGAFINVPKYEVSGETITLSLENVQDNVGVNKSITLAETVEVDYNGKKVTATNGSIIYPDGKTYGTGTHVMLDTGKYVIKYYVKDGNKVVTAEKSFIVTDALYTLSFEGGNITPVKAADTEGMILDTNDDDVLLNNGDGLIVRLQEGCEFVYNKVIDLSKCDEDGIADILTLNYRLANLRLYTDEELEQLRNIPYESFRFDSKGNLLEEYKYKYVENIAERCKIRLVDAYNPDLYVELDEQIARLTTNTSSSLYSQNYRLSYSAAANGQLLTGCSIGTSASEYGPVAEIDGVHYMAYTNWNRAAYIGGYLMSSGVTMKNGVTWGYDYKENRIYATHGGPDGTYTIITDVDHPSIYPGNEFPGFTTGEVYLSISFTGYSKADYARFDLLSIGGDSGMDLVEAYGKGVQIDDVAPEVAIDYNETDPGVVYAKLGDNFEIPSAFVKDAFASGEYEVNVYTNYYSASKKNVSVKNNKFTLSENAVYTIEYTAKDYTGQVGKATMNVCPVPVENNIWVETNKITEVEAGSLITLPEYEMKTINKESDVKLTIKAVHDKETIIIDNAERTFRPLYTGKYKIVYEYEDNCFKDSFEYEMTSKSSGGAKFASAPFVPRYLFKGDTYSFEDLKAYKYSANGKEEVDTDAYISVDGGEFVKLSNLKYKVEANDSVEIQFRCGDVVSEISKGKVISKTDNVNGKDVYRVYKLFVGDYTTEDTFNASGRPTTKSIKYDVKQKNGDAVLSFANMVDCNSFKFQFITGNATNYNALVIRLTDVYDLNKFVEVKFTTSNVGHLISLGDKSEFVNATLKGSSIRTIEYDSAKKAFRVDSTYNFNYLFDEFTSTKCYFDVIMEDLTATPSLTVESVGNHPFRGNKVVDDIDPEINVFTSDGNYKVGDKVTLNVPSFVDVASQIDYGMVRGYIYHEDEGETEISDITKEYVLELKNYGAYTITYATADTNGNEIEYSYVITAADTTAPVITVHDYAENTMVLVKRGATFALNYTVEDDYTDVENIVVAVRVENMTTGAVSIPTSKTEIECRDEGDYKINIIARDPVGNLSYKVIYIRVQGGK